MSFEMAAARWIIFKRNGNNEIIHGRRQKYERLSRVEFSDGAGAIQIIRGRVRSPIDQ